MFFSPRPILVLTFAGCLLAGCLLAGCGSDTSSDWQIDEDDSVSVLDEIARCRDHHDDQAWYYHTHRGSGGWIAALPPSVTDIYNLRIDESSHDDVTAAVYSSEDLPLAGAIFSQARSTDDTSPTRILAAKRAAIAEWASVEEASESAAFSTFDGRQAATGSYIVRLDEASSTQALRDDLLFSTAPFSAEEVVGLPAPSAGGTSDEARREASAFRLHVAAITSAADQEPFTWITFALAPFEAGAQPALAFALDDLTNTTHLARTGAEHALRCGVFSARPASRYRLEQAPITSTLRVELGGTYVPRSHDNGWDYHPQTNAIELFGSFRDQARSSRRVELRLSFETFLQ